MAIARPSMVEIQNLQFAMGKFCFIRLQTSIMVYEINLYYVDKFKENLYAATNRVDFPFTVHDKI